jgi:hypothetical protein
MSSEAVRRPSGVKRHIDTLSVPGHHDVNNNMIQRSDPLEEDAECVE